MGGPREVHLYSDDDLPGWVARVQTDASFVFHRSTRLFASATATRNLEDATASLLLWPWGQGNWSLTVSRPERAILELLDEVPHRETFHQADMIIEGLTNLSPRRLHPLLADCRSVKVKRLFLWFAERHNQAWLKKLDRTGIDLGRGKRMRKKNTLRLRASAGRKIRSDPSFGLRYHGSTVDALSASIEVVSDEMAVVLRGKTGAERLEIASRMFSSARSMLLNHLRSIHPDWDSLQIEREAARRLCHGAI